MWAMNIPISHLQLISGLLEKDSLNEYCFSLGKLKDGEVILLEI